MRVRINPEIFEMFPKTNIGFVVATINVTKTHDHTESLKSSLASELAKANITKHNYAENVSIKNWRNVFKTFKEEKSKRSSAEALLRRILGGNKMWNINNVVDLYNCTSTLSLFPMGGYDLSNIVGDIELRFGKEGDQFIPLGTTQPLNPKRNHVVYADDEKVLCWLWNYKDSALSCIKPETENAIFFFDSTTEINHWRMDDAINFFSFHLQQINASILTYGILNSNKSEIALELNQLEPLPLFSLPDIGINTEKKDLESHSSALPKMKTNHKKIETELLSFDDPMIRQRFTLFQQNELTADYAIHAAATGQYDNLVRILSSDSDLYAANDYFNNNLLNHAVRGGHTNILQFLLSSQKFNIDHQNKLGDTALIIAARHNQVECFQILLAFTPSPSLDVINSEGQTAMEIAKQRGFNQILDLISTFSRIKSVSESRFSN